MSTGPEPAALPPITAMRQCPLPRGCGRYLTGSQFASSNSDGRHPYCVECAKRHADEREIRGKVADAREIARRVMSAAKEAEKPKVKFPRTDEIAAIIAAKFGGVEKWADCLIADYHGAKDESTRMQVHKMFVQVANWAGKQEVAEKGVEELSNEELAAQIQQYLQQLVLESSPEAIIDLIGREKVRDIVLAVDGAVVRE